VRTRLQARTGNAAAGAKPESLGFRAGGAADRDAITGLFREAFGRRMGRREWDWRFLRKPGGKGLIELAWDGATLAGHYAVSPTRLRVRGKEVPAALSGTTMTHARYRGLGLFPLLARRTYARARQAGHVLVMGFPNRYSHRGLVRDLGWRDVYEVPRFSLHLGDRRRETEDGGVARVVELDRFDRRFDRLWDEVKDTCPVSVVRDRRYLQWRFAENPESRYRIFAFEDGRSIGGYAVAKRFGKEMHVVDILCLNADTGVRLVRRVAMAAARQGLSAVSMWLNPGLELHRELERLGFQPGAPVTYFCVLPLGAASLLRGACDFRNWYLTMADSDVY